MIPLLDTDDLVHHLVTDLLIKGVIVVVAAILVIVGMVVLWRRLG